MTEKLWDTSPQKFEELFDRYSDYPKGIIIKIATMIWGVRFSPSLLKTEQMKKTNTARYFIFSFDMEKTDDMDEELGKIPTYFRLKNIDNHRFGPVVQVRPKNNSPYFFELINGKMMLCEQFPDDKEPKAIVEIEFDQKPDFNDKTDSKGEPFTNNASLIFWGEQLYCCLLRACQYWQGDLQCKFCDLNSIVINLRKQGINMPATKTPEILVEAIKAAQEEKDSHLQIIFLSGGAVTDKIQGMDGLEWYMRFPEAIKENFGRRYATHLQTVALPYEKCVRLFEAGVDIHEANIEVWEPHLFKWICPGKEKYVGRDEWIKRVIKSVDAFGIGNVVPVFVQGVEMAQPYGFKEVDAAVESTLNAWDYLMSYGVTPRFDIWALEAGSSLWESQQDFYPPPIEYFLKTTRGAYDLLRKHHLPVARGYVGGSGGYGVHMFGQTAQWDFDEGVRYMKGCSSGDEKGDEQE